MIVDQPDYLGIEAVKRSYFFDEFRFHKPKIKYLVDKVNYLIIIFRIVVVLVQTVIRITCRIHFRTPASAPVAPTGPDRTPTWPPSSAHTATRRCGTDPIPLKPSSTSSSNNR